MDVRLRAEAQSNHMEGGRSLQSVKMVCNSMYGIHNRIGCQRSRRFFFSCSIIYVLGFPRGGCDAFLLDRLK